MRAPSLIEVCSLEDGRARARELARVRRALRAGRDPAALEWAPLSWERESDRARYRYAGGGIGLGLPTLAIGSGGAAEPPPPSTLTNVKAFFRADQGVTLNGSTVSAWAPQGSGSITAFTQGTGANQPTYETAGLNSRPCLLFDGTSDWMAAGALSEWIAATTGAVYLLLRPLAATLSAGAAYQYHPIWQNAGAYAGVTIKSGPSLWAFNYDGTYDEASLSTTLSTTQIARWRHAGGNLYLAVGASESTGVASGSTSLLTGLNRLGSNPGYNDNYANMRLAAIVAMNTSPTSAEDAVITAWLKWYGGI